MSDLTDADIVSRLADIDEDDDIDVDEWEAEFLDSVKKMPKPRVLSPKQRAAALKMIERYLS